MQKFLIIQTAFVGDVVLATGLIEKLHAHFPDAQIDFLLRKGNEGILKNHPYLHEVLIWDKKNGKYASLLKMANTIRKNHYDKVINVQRFAATGFLTVYSGAKEKIGFTKNPFRLGFNVKVPHPISADGKPVHEIQRNLELVRHFTDSTLYRPRLYPSHGDDAQVSQYKNGSYMCIAPASVWFTKQYPAEKWISFIKKLPHHLTIYLLGAPGEKDLCEKIQMESGHSGITNLAGRLSFLESASLMKDAVMNYVNDSAPMHFASAMNAPVTAVYCSTIPAFGFGPLSDTSVIVEIEEKLYCRPCGLHGYKACPEGHFRCAFDIRDEQLLHALRT